MEIYKSYYIEELQKINQNYDTEAAHADADYVLCELLEKLGYKDIVEEYKKIEKWYA